MSVSRLKQFFAPLIYVGKGYDGLARAFPRSTAIITTTFKTSAADAFAQIIIEHKEDLDWRRHAMFCSFGFVYLGCWQYYLYNSLFVKWCGPITRTFGHIGAAPVKTFIDQAIHHPLFYFPSFYLLKGYVEDQDPWVSLERCNKDMWVNLKALWSVWVPAQLINFALVPMHLRIPFVAAVSFLWTVIISCLRGSLDSKAGKAPPAAAGPGGIEVSVTYA